MAGLEFVRGRAQADFEFRHLVWLQELWLIESVAKARADHPHRDISRHAIRRNVDEAREKIRVGPGARGVEHDFGIAGDFHRRSERLGLIDENVRPLRERTLIGGHGEHRGRPQGRHRIARVVTVQSPNDGTPRERTASGVSPLWKN